MKDDSVDEDGTRKIIIDDPAVDASFTKFLYFEGRGDVGKERVEPGGDDRAGDLRGVGGRFVHKNE